MRFAKTLLVVLSLLFSSLSFADELPRDPATAMRVVDGDTIEVLIDGKKEKVRLIGVDTPEKFSSAKLSRDAQRTGKDKETIKVLGRRASSFASALVAPGDPISLEYNTQKRDRYGRLLAFVWLKDKRMMNEVIVCGGYASAMLQYAFRKDYQERFRTCEQQARKEKKGLWADGMK